MGVSILTGPEGPVQQIHAEERRYHQGVSILTGPEGPVQR